MSTLSYVYYDARTVLQHESMKDIENALKSLGGIIEVAEFPSGHKVWRIFRPRGEVPIIKIRTKEYGPIAIEPAYDYGLEPMLSPWVKVTL